MGAVGNQKPIQQLRGRGCPARRSEGRPGRWTLPALRPGGRLAVRTRAGSDSWSETWQRGAKVRRNSTMRPILRTAWWPKELERRWNEGAGACA